jgi:hypothetical protein
MLRALLSWRIGRFERAWRYDAGYMRRILAASPITLLRFSMLTSLTRRREAPAAALAAAGLVGTLAEDCGPCTQISLDMAAKAGVPAVVLRAVLAGDEAAMGADAALAWRFARASLARDLEAADQMREEVVRRWGEKGLVALAMALTSARMYPTVKYALGHGKTCSRVEVAGQPAPVRRAA